MKCLNCKKNLNSGILWGLWGESKEKLPMTKRIFAFCNEVCQEQFFMDKRWFSKTEISLWKRIKTRQEVIQELQEAFLKSDNDNEKDLIDVLRKEMAWKTNLSR